MVISVKEKKDLKMNIGGGSVILILLIFALSTFAVLSIKASSNELGLAKKTATAIQGYYKADTRATEILAQIAGMIHTFSLEELESQLLEMDEITEVYFVDDKSMQIGYEIEINENAILQVSIIASENHSYKITKWKTIQSDNNEYEFGFEMENLWDGNTEE